MIKYIKWYWMRIKAWYRTYIDDVYFKPARLRKEYTEPGPGKYEGNPAYVRYMWERLMQWGEYPDYEYMADIEERERNDYYEAYKEYPDWDEYVTPDIYTFRVTDLERKAWPELEDVDNVHMRIDDYGFVHSWED